MPSKTNLHILSLLLLCVLCACDTTGARLRSIDAKIEADPAQAFAALQQLPAEGFSAADSAYYALLYTQAQISNGENVASDELIRVAYERYKNSGDADLRRRACFFKARIAFYRGEYREAMQDAIIAYDIAHDEHDALWIARTAEIMCDILFNTYNYAQAEGYAAEAAAGYLKAGTKLKHRYALCDYSTVLMNNSKPVRARQLLDSLQLAVIGENPVDTVLDDYCLVYPS
ncbi:MAG: hypothetical protein K2M12_03335, partial [Muribaculaceae bacterium]|nr:hypothetical protein [Muribaculaceae bacterium]